MIGLVAAGRRIDVGRFVPESERRDLATQLRAQLLRRRRRQEEGLFVHGRHHAAWGLRDNIRA